MPIMRCTKNGKSGFKYGEEGACYVGPGAREKAAKQGRAIEMSKHAKGKDFFIEEVAKTVNSDNK